MYQPQGSLDLYVVTCFTSRKDSMPSSPLSRPMPLLRTPPHGAWQKQGWEQLTQQIPALTPRMTRCARTSSLDSTAAASPKLESFASSSACAYLKGLDDQDGPEDLFLPDRHVWLDVDEDRRSKVETAGRRIDRPPATAE